ncbi:translation initiation factor IF-2-like [Phyllostomus discolor]|uniref:Translation initiation factor IF-2-like n=1 Tax=Phyllostomus discolor TaxID=89673 RepID=A0A7E6DNP2_9CHIR|nr:translation initiation factor IF-2-like [Phyllostomus discolor]
MILKKQKKVLFYEKSTKNPGRPRLLGNRPPPGGGAGWSRNPGEEGGSCTAPTTLLGAHRPSSDGSNRRQPPGKAQLSKNLKANSLEPLPALGAASVTPAHAGRRPGSEDAGGRARARRGMGGAYGGDSVVGVRLRSAHHLLLAGRVRSWSGGGLREY